MTKIVKKVFSKKSAVLVEYLNDAGVPVRVSIPTVHSRDLGDGRVEVSKDILEMGIPYGVPWSALLGQYILTGEAVEREFHKAGIWTWADYQHNPSALPGIIMAVASGLVKAITQVAKEHSSKEA